MVLYGKSVIFEWCILGKSVIFEVKKLEKVSFLR